MGRWKPSEPHQHQQDRSADTEAARGHYASPWRSRSVGQRRRCGRGLCLGDWTSEEELGAILSARSSADIFHLIQIRPVASGFHVVALYEPQQGRMDAITQAAT